MKAINNHSQFSILNSQLSYKQKLSLCFFLIFALFTCGIIVFERSHETSFRTEALIEKLDAYTEIAQSIIEKQRSALANGENDCSFSILNSQFSILPRTLRLTLIDRQGNVIYDNAIVDSLLSENHAQRPEIIQAKTKGSGSDIRTSATNDRKYLYYARRYNDYYIRAALPYDVQVQNFLKSDNLFLYYIAGLFIITLFLINYMADRFGKSIRKLKEFAFSMENAQNNSPFSILHSPFPKDELGEIGRKIMDNYEQLNESRREVAFEREKLLQHIHSSGEGLCFFSRNKIAGFYNGLFIQYLNTITDEPTSDPAALFSDASFRGVIDFLDKANPNATYYETQIDKQGKFFQIRINIFEDKSLEIIITDVTEQGKTRLLKQEMTSNIAHELRTPVTSIRGYLEIALGQPLDGEKAYEFLSKAHDQTIVLSELIQDMSLITKMEEAPASFRQESVDIEKVLDSIKNEFDELLTEKNIRMEWKNVGDSIVCGNRNLLYSLFRNLTENAIRYAGTGITITVNKYKEDKDFYYFSYADTGVGIPDSHHLNRIFERFYRINAGRTRDTGGSGLGLSIVKNAVLFHKGTIAAKNRAESGLEFLFTLPRNISSFFC